MWRATLSSLLAHKLRLALTTLAIVFGVAFIAGTLIYTDTTRSSFDSVFGQITGSIDYSIRGVSQLSDAEGGNQFELETPPVPPEVADRVAAVEGVAGVERNVESLIQLLDADGQPAGSGQGPPSLGFNAPTVDELSPTELRGGRYPTAADEVALDAGTADDLGFGVGDTVQIATDGPIEDYRVVGVYTFGDGVDSLGGASATLFAPDTAFELFARDGGYSGVDVLAAEGARLDDLRDRLETAAGDDFEVVGSDELASEAQEASDTIVGFLGNALLIFAGVSLLVGAFLINNTFAIIVAQRSRELALLRAVGASRAQVLGSVMTEAAVVGVFASALGVGAGVGVAIALRAVLSAFGIDIGDAALVFAGRTAMISMSVGVIITLLSALLPATRALRVPPVAAMQAVAVGDTRGGGRVRTVVGGLLALAGLGLLGAGLFGDAPFSVVIGGALALLLGAALLARFVTRPLLAIIGWPLQRTGVRGTLAQQNAIRSPQRTASTASALMIGLGLVTFALIFGASLRASTTAAVDEQFLSDFQVTTTNFESLPSEVEGEISALPEVADTIALRITQIGVRDRVGFAAAIQPDELGRAFDIEALDGSLDDFAAGGLLLSDDVAERLAVGPGDSLPVTFATSGEQSLPVRAVIDGSQFDFDYLIDEDTVLANGPDEAPSTLYLRIGDGVGVEQARTAIEGATADYAALQVQDSAQLKEQIGGQVDQILGLISALLGLSVLIALFGITNTLSLSVLERVRELGLLRAVGATRRQIRSIVRWESVLIAVLGAVFGIGIGVVFGWMSVQALADQGVSVFAFPGVQIALAVVAAAVAGTLAAVLPARRAARVDVLRALAAN